MTMVGLKTFWITLCTLFLFAACVPQTKQTECKSNEAFNASLRTCVPIVGGPSSFINIASFAPLSSITKFKNDGTTMTFQITVSNPYNQSYSVEWERVFNGTTTNMCSNALTCLFSPNLLGTVLGEVGTHVLIAKIKDGNGTTVDSHNFEIRIVDLPKPVINTVSLRPEMYSPGPFLPTDPRIEFRFTINNNGALFTSSDNYRTVWFVSKNGSNIYTESDSFANFSSTGTNSAYLGTSPTPYFNPLTLGVGSYVVRAVVQNDNPGEVVAEQQWSFIVRQPDLANVSNISAPAPGVTITAHNNVPRNATPTDVTWIYGSLVPPQKPNFCVTIDDRDGTYPSDGQSIQVRFYLNGVGGDICTKRTLDTPGSQMICLIDSNNCEGATPAPFDESLLVFSNANTTSPQLHKVTARLFDEATSMEFERSDVLPSNGSYPIEWIVNVKPQNTAPVMGFGTTNPTGCISSGAYSRTGCQVTQGTDFTVSFTVTDDFYTGAVNPEEFQWTLNLKYNGADIVSPDAAMNTTCSKAFGTATTLPAGLTSGYTTQWTCTLAVPHYISTGPLNPASGSYQVVATMQDRGSPVGGAPAVSLPLTWTLVVTESNPATLDLTAQGPANTDSHVIRSATGGNPTTVIDPGNVAHYASELETITFRPRVFDGELDNFDYRVSLCTDRSLTCASSTTLTTPAYNNFIRAIQGVPDTNPVVIPGFVYTIPEDFLISRHTTPIDVGTTSNELVYFKVDIYDVPSVLTTPVRTDSEIFQIRVRNVNPPPVLSGTPSPAVGTYTVYSGYQFTIDPGTVSDPSGPAVERNLTYQWYARIGAGAWTSISGADERVLRYTPGNAAGNIELKLCYGDGTVANPVSSTGACSSVWTIIPRPFLNNLPHTNASSVAANSIQNELATWFDEFQSDADTEVIYSAYVDSSLDIWVEKTVVNTTTNAITSTASLNFTSIPSGTPSTVANLSITGTEESLYIAYLASSTSAPSTQFPRIRRIDKRFIASTSEKSGLAHPGTFGFTYADYALSASCTATTTCTVSTPTGDDTPRTIDFGGPGTLTAGDTITINNTTFTAGTGTGPTDICDNTICATGNSTASNLASKINSSALSDLQGIRAVAIGARVELYGQWDADYLDFDGTMISVAPNLAAGLNGQGKIFIQNGRWNLPVINSSLGGALQNNITVLSNTADAHLRASVVTDTDILSEIGAVSAFDHQINSLGEMVIAAISAKITDSGKLSLWRYTLPATDWTVFDPSSTGLTTDAASRPIFAAYAFEYVKLAANKASNPYYYVIAKEQTINGGEYHVGRYDFQLDTAATFSENFLMGTGVLDTTDSTTTFISDTLLRNPVLVSVPGFPEARLFFHSDDGVDQHPRIARWRSNNIISCGSCSSLNGTLEYQDSAIVGVSQVVENITFGQAGATVGENTNDVVFVLFSSDTNADDVFRPQLGFINIEAESIQSDTQDATGMWHPPFVLD